MVTIDFKGTFLLPTDEIHLYIFYHVVIQGFWGVTHCIIFMEVWYKIIEVPL